MLKYETVIHIISSGKDEIEAGEKAGNIVDMKKAEERGLVVECEPTRMTTVFYNDDGCFENEYETIIRVIGGGNDETEASEIAGEIIDIRMMEKGMYLFCGMSQMVYSDYRKNRFAAFEQRKKAFFVDVAPLYLE